MFRLVGLLPVFIMTATARRSYAVEHDPHAFPCKSCFKQDNEPTLHWGISYLHQHVGNRIGTSRRKRVFFKWFWKLVHGILSETE